MKRVQLIAVIIAIGSTAQLAMAAHHPLHCARWQRNCQKHEQYCTLNQKSCCDILKSYESSGDFIQEQTNNTQGLTNDIYLLKKSTYSTSLAYCDMTTAEGGWMVILRRADGIESFPERYYDEYEDGFGELNHDFFYGLRALHDLTSQTTWVLRIDFYNHSNDTETSAHVTYDNFIVGHKKEGYALQLGRFESSESTLLDNLRVFENQEFVARNRGEPRLGCLTNVDSGAWWYNKNEDCKGNTGSVLTDSYPLLEWYDPLEMARYRSYGKYELKIRQKNCLSSINLS
jgi:hypothetical protein